MTTSQARASFLPGLDTSRAARSQELLAYLRLTAAPHFLALLSLLGLALWQHSAAMWYLFTVAGINTTLAMVSYALARRDYLQVAISVYVAGLALLVAAMFAFGHVFYAIACGMVFLPVMMSMPYMSDRGILACSGVMTLIFSVAAVTTLYPPLLQLGFGAQVHAVAIAFVVTVVSTIAALTLWYNARLLDRAAHSSSQANRELKIAERHWERQVELRTAELVQTNAKLQTARDEAVAADAQSTEFLGKMSHELRTPLNAVIGFSDMLRQGYVGALNDKQNEYVGDILASANHLLLLINDVLDLSKVEAGQLEMDAASFDFDAMLQGALVLISQRAARQGLKLENDIPELVGQVIGDQRKLKQVVINLLTNAVKFTPNGGSITLGATRRDDAITVWIEDTGKGIAENEQSLIFEPFRQASGTTAVEEGTGLGLSLSRRIVEMHGGTISVSSAPNQGSKFSFHIPVARLKS